jgi:VanZ family protein
MPGLTFNALVKPINDLLTRQWLAITFLMLAAITIASLMPAEALPPVPGTDKTHHFIAYGLLMFPVAFVRPRHWLLIGCVFVLYSGAIELIQPYVNRYGEWLDMLANAGGTLCGVFTAYLYRLLLRK